MAAPNLKEIEWAISELEQEESSFPVYAKLAILYTARNALKEREAHNMPIQTYSNATSPDEAKVGRYGSSDFLQSVEGKDPQKAWAIIDELMETLRVVNVRVYDGVLRKLDRI